MNLEQVFTKTRDGEEAINQRTRLVQRNLRTVLILIDGKSTVGDLIEKVGSEEVLFGALEQLERDGFIRSAGGGSANQPRVTGSDSMENFLEPASDESFPSMLVDGTAKSPFAGAGASAYPFAPPPVAPEVKPTPTSIDAVSISPFSVSTPLSAAPTKPASSPFNAPASNPFAPVGAAGSPFGSPTTAAEKPAVVRQPEQEEVEEEPALPIDTKPYKPHQNLFTPKRLLIGGAASLLIFVLVILVYPYDSYRPRIEAALSEVAGQTVKIASVSAAFSPAPTLVLSQVSIGMGSDGGEISIAEVRAAPSIFSLLSARKSFNRVTLKGAQVPMAQLGVIASGLSGAGKSQSFSVARVDLEQMTLALRDITFQDYSGRADLSPEGGLKQMELRSKDGTMSVLVGPGATEKDPTAVTVQGSGWKSAEGSPFVFDSLTIQGELTGTRFAAQKIEGRIFGGVINGQLQTDWSSGMLVSGDVNVDYMAAPQLAKALGSGSITVEGQASARIRFRASGESWSAIAGKIPLEGSFLAKTGVINGLDLVEAVRRGSKLATRGGSTRYEQLQGKFRWDGNALQLSEIDLSSGVMRSTGSLGVVKNGQINGLMSVVLQSSAATMRTPVSIIGTLNDPQLFGGRN